MKHIAALKCIAAMKCIAAFVLGLIMCAGLCASVAFAVCEHGSEAYDLVERIFPTCTEMGVIVTRCRICGDTQTEYTEPLGHSGITDPEKPATCAAEGHGPQLICSRCNFVITPGRVIPKLPHTPKVVEERIEPTETEDGWTEKVVCSVCGTVLQEKTRIPAKRTPAPDPTIKPTEKPTEEPTERPTEEPTVVPEPTFMPEPTAIPTSIPSSDTPARTGGGGQGSRGGRNPFSVDFPFRRLRFEHAEKIVPVIAGEKFELHAEGLIDGQANGISGGRANTVGQTGELTGKETDSRTGIAGQAEIPAISRADGQMLLLGGMSIPLDFAGTLTGTPMILDGSDIELNITTGLGRISVAPQGKCLVIIAPYT